MVNDLEAQHGTPHLRLLLRCCRYSWCATLAIVAPTMFRPSGLSPSLSLVALLLLPNISLGGRAAPSAAFTSTQPSRSGRVGPRCQSNFNPRPAKRQRAPVSTSIMSIGGIRLRRRPSSLQINNLADKTDDVERTNDNDNNLHMIDEEASFPRNHDGSKNNNTNHNNTTNNNNKLVLPLGDDDDDGRNNNNTPLLVWGVPVQSILLLNIAAVLWGTQHAVIKSVVDDISLGPPDVAARERLRDLLVSLNVGPREEAGAMNDGESAAYFTLARFGLAALLAGPYTPGLNGMLTRLKCRILGGVRATARDVDDESTVSTAITDDDSLDVSQRNDAIIPATETIITSERHQTNLAWRYGLELGIYMFLGYAFQAVGLETTTASRSGFLLYLNVKLVPFFSFLLFGKRIRASTWLSALAAFGGTALLTLDNSDASRGVASFGLNEGDVWSIAAAAASAMFILRTEAASKAVSKSSELNAASLWAVCLLSLVWTFVISWNNLLVDAETASNAQSAAAAIRHTFNAALATFVDHPLQMLYLSAVTTTLANYVQSKGQRDVSAERASIIYAMDPVYGAAVANLLLGEQLGLVGWIGSGMIFVAAATNALFDFGPAGDDDKR